MILAVSAVPWYLARAGGLVAFALLTASVLLGLTLSGRARLPRWPRFALEDVHRFAGLLAGTFVLLHGLALFVDGYMRFSLAELTVPGLSHYRPLPTALGILGAELLAAIAITNRYRKRLSHRFWRRVHYANFAVWALALGHGVSVGTDSRTSWGLALYTVAAGSVAGATVWRAVRARSADSWSLRLWPGAAAVTAVELVLALAVGLHHGG